LLSNIAFLFIDALYGFTRAWPPQLLRLLEACFSASGEPTYDTMPSTANQAQTIW